MDAIVYELNLIRELLTVIAVASVAGATTMVATAVIGAFRG